MKSTINGMFSRSKKSEVCDQMSIPKEAEWELRPGGMLVQKRISDLTQNSVPFSIKIKVKHASTNHEVRISPHASFGELKKMLAEITGLHPQDQKLMYKKKERDSKSYLDEVKVKDGSKMEVVVDTESRQRRVLEMLKMAKKDKTFNSLSRINLEIEKLAKQVAALEASACSGGIIAQMDVDNLTGNLMRILIQLDETVAEGDLKLQRKEQVRRVQKQIEGLDRLKVPNFLPRKREDNMAFQSEIKVQIPNVQQEQQRQPLRHSESFVVTTKWETFD